MRSIPKPIRIEPAFDDPQQVRALFERHAPYRSNAYYLPIKLGSSGLPWFRGTWALGGESLVEGAEAILHNQRFIEAARTLFGTSRLRPSLIVVNVNAPMTSRPGCSRSCPPVRRTLMCPTSAARRVNTTRTVFSWL
jgi:hypothetical protein